MTAQQILASITPDNMETLARAVLMLSPESQDQFFASLLDGGLTADEVQSLQMCVGLYKLHTDMRYRKAVQAATYELYTSGAII